MVSVIPKLGFLNIDNAILEDYLFLCLNDNYTSCCVVWSLWQQCSDATDQLLDFGIEYGIVSKCRREIYARMSRQCSTEYSFPLSCITHAWLHHHGDHNCGAFLLKCMLELEAAVITTTALVNFIAVGFRYEHQDDI